MQKMLLYFLAIVIPTLALSQPQTQPVLVPGYIPGGTKEGVIFSNNFESALDLNGDSWPDGWVRRMGVDFPQHILIQTVQFPSPISSNVLRMNMNTGGASVSTPLIPAKNGMSYAVRVVVSSNNTQHNDIFASLTFYDAEEKPIEQPPILTRKIRNTPEWTELRIEPTPLNAPKAAFARIGLHVVPSRRQDLSAIVDFALVELLQSPTITLKSNQTNNIFPIGSSIEVSCDVAGITPKQGKVRFIAEDAFGNSVLPEKDDSFFGDLPPTPLIKGDKNFLSGRAIWQPQLTKPGFYRIRVEIDGTDPFAESNRLNLVVLESISGQLNGEFGWTFPNTLTPKELLALRPIISQAAISCIKIPVWLDPNSPKSELDTLSLFCEWLADRKIETVGLLSNPPQSVKDNIRLSDVKTASIFSLTPEIWFPTLEPILIRLAMLIQHWQLGDDEDRSITEITPLLPKITEIRDVLNRAAFDVSIGFGWDWIEPIPPTFLLPTPQFQPVALNRDFRQRSREFVSLSSQTPLTSENLEHYLTASASPNVRKWVALRPLSKYEFTLETRIRDMLSQMIVSKIHGADALFVSEPFNAETGLFSMPKSASTAAPYAPVVAGIPSSPSGISKQLEYTKTTPTELFVPWRTASRHLSDKQFVGSITLPNKSANMFFENEHNSVMLLWNPNATLDSPTTETIFLGHEAEIMDLWGVRSRPMKDGFRQIIPVGPLPTFVTGLDMDVTRWRQQFALEKKNIPSTIGPPHQNSFTFVNESQFGVAGTITAVPPDTWRVDPTVTNLTVPSGETVVKPFTITLLPRAVSEPQMLRFDLRFDGTEAGVFDVYDEIDVGGEYIKMQFVTRLNVRRNELEVHQAFINDSDQTVSYTCILRIPGRPFQRHNIANQGFGRTEHIYYIENGDELIGKTLSVEARGLSRGAQNLRFEFQANR